MGYEVHDRRSFKFHIAISLGHVYFGLIESSSGAMRLRYTLLDRVFVDHSMCKSVLEENFLTRNWNERIYHTHVSLYPALPSHFASASTHLAHAEYHGSWSIPWPRGIPLDSSCFLSPYQSKPCLRSIIPASNVYLTHQQAPIPVSQASPLAQRIDPPKSSLPHRSHGTSFYPHPRCRAVWTLVNPED